MLNSFYTYAVADESVVVTHPSRELTSDLDVWLCIHILLPSWDKISLSPQHANKTPDAHSETPAVLALLVAVVPRKHVAW